MGFGEFGSNGSVHWRIVHTSDQRNGGFVRGRDPNVPHGIELKHVKPAEYTIRLRMTKEELLRAVERAIERDGVVSFKIKTCNPTRPKTREVEFEVRVEW